MTALDLQGRCVPVTLRRSSRARRISLRVSQLDGRVTLTVPSGVSEREALAFAESKSDWLGQHLGRMPDVVTIADGVDLPLEGIPRRVVYTSGRRVTLRADTIEVPENRAGARLAAWLKSLARDRLAAASDHYAGQLGRPYAKLTLRDTRSRWGSCSSAGGLMFSWRLILAPPEVLRYVAAHEVAHLAEMNHSRAFWNTVRHIHGPYEQPRAWLRTRGNALHRYRFESADRSPQD